MSHLSLSPTCIYREGSTAPEGTQALWVNQITAAHFGNVDPEAMIKLIESLT